MKKELLRSMVRQILSEGWDGHMYTKSGAESHPSFPRLRKWARRLSIDPERGPFDRVIISLTRDGKLRVQVTGEFESTSTSWGPPNVYSSVGGDYNIAGERSQRTVDVNVRNLIELLELSPGRWRVTASRDVFPMVAGGDLRSFEKVVHDGRGAGFAQAKKAFSLFR